MDVDFEFLSWKKITAIEWVFIGKNPGKSMIFSLLQDSGKPGKHSTSIQALISA